MPALTRRRDPDVREERWRVFYGDVHPGADPDVARKILELANDVETIQDGRIYIEEINGPMLFQLRQRYAGKLKLTDVKEMFLQMRDHA